MLRAIQDSLLSVLYPQVCRVCGGTVERSDDGVACGECWAGTRILTGSEMLCMKCGAYLNESAKSFAVSCHKCDGHSYDKAAAVGIYEKALAASIIHLKNTPFVANRLRRGLLTAFQRSGFDDTTRAIAVPLSAKRRVERGYNQAEILAGIVAKGTGIRLDCQSLSRKLHTPMHRIGMDEKARELTVHKAFEVTRPKLIEGQNILLIDDVFTSGATASYCAKVLKKHGAAKVNVLTLARAVLS